MNADADDEADVVGTGTGAVAGKGADDEAGVVVTGAVASKDADDEAGFIDTGTGAVAGKGADDDDGVEGDTEAGVVRSNTSSS